MSQLSAPLRIALVGMDQRVKYMLGLFFKGACKNSCVIVEDKLAEISMVDMDSPNAQALYDGQRIQFPTHQYIVLSLGDKNIADAFYVAKPIKVGQLLEVLTKLRKIRQAHKLSSDIDVLELKECSVRKTALIKQKTSNDKASAYKPAMRLDESNATSYMGALHAIDINDEKQCRMASYKPNNFLQAYVEHAYDVALSKNKIVSLEHSWKPIIIFPEKNKVYIDANEKQLQAVCRIQLDVFSHTSGLAVSLHDEMDESALETYRVFSMDAFLWQITLWTAQGRYPEKLDLSQAVFLREWPNMTRLMLFPHAMRIAALMHEKPRNLIDIARLLNVPEQYVFAFYSAAHSIGLANQAVRQVDSMVKHELPTKPKKRGIFARILGRLTSR